MIRLVYITTKDRKEAQTIGKALIERRLAACVNILDGMTSMYRWEGKLEEATETVLIAKTTHDKAEAVVAAAKELHSYKTPCALTLPVEGGNAAYLSWLQGELQ